jgi:polyhydroxyalkanoate synthase subunit PhaC
MTSATAATYADPLRPQGSTPRRRGPRPLALHLALAVAAARGGPAADISLPARFLAGLHAYWRHPYRRALAEPPTLWSEGATGLLDYGPADGPPLLVVPSLINRAYILDLAPGRSLLRHLAEQGLRPLLVDWGEPGPVERRMTLDDYLRERLEAALDATRHATGRPPVLLGYCMGGLLAVALALRRQDNLAGLVLLATPWDFHAAPMAPRLRALLSASASGAGLAGGLPVELIQSLFAGIDPLAVPRKFARFAELDPRSPDAQVFVAVEDWLNDGVALGAEVARECLLGWYLENRPARGAWQVGGQAVRPERLSVPALIAIPTRDRIVPPASAAALAARLPGASVLEPEGGHVGMIVAGSARRRLWAPLVAWLRRIAAMQK